MNGIKGNEKFVLVALADNASDNKGEAGTCYPSIKTIMEKTGLSNRAVINNLDSLISKGLLLKQYRSRKSGGRTSNKYLILPSETLYELDEEMRFFFSQSEECSHTQSEECSQQKTTTQSEECSQGYGTQSEECSQECEPSLNYNHHLLPQTPAKNPAPLTTKNPKLIGIAACVETMQGMFPQFSKENFAEVVEYRKSLKKPVTQRALEGIFKEMSLVQAKTGMSTDSMLELMQERGWQTIKLEWVLNTARQKAQSSNNQSLTDIIWGWEE